ncbi:MULTISPECIES: hypothetical protein [unclassified Moorena]|uniref:hypothetical protein n=1 Tax=unclassified Moorena TaxID=2683338 RepID=UPI0013C05260|nr:MULTISPECIES: hypothetical protein [unclassified Moorena]NES42225.1 hypothetical protein [Moorena sp. SIO2C4]NET68507.1 hypothetical protein [Moorena sp. SIO1G6]
MQQVPDPVVRYGADYTNPGYEAKNKGKSAPNAPYALPTPDSRFPVPYLMLKLCPTILTMMLLRQQ